MKYEKLGSWIPAGKNPDAMFNPSLPVLVCLNTSTHTVLINGQVFSDYDESESPDVIMEVQKVAENALNSGKHGLSVDRYELGIEGTVPIKMRDGSYKEIQHIGIGEVLANGGLVKGIVKEQVSSIVKLKNGYKVSASQLFWSESDSAWVRAGVFYNSLPANLIFYQIISDKSILETPEYIFRDYREVDVNEMEEAYEKKIKSGI